jgi:hypothetical protein
MALSKVSVKITPQEEFKKVRYCVSVIPQLLAASAAKFDPTGARLHAVHARQQHAGPTADKAAAERL